MDSKSRFSNRVDDYAKFRPTYPDGVVETLVTQFNLSPSSQIVDVGSGTGISAELFLRKGFSVVGVEPNDAMRKRSEEILRDYDLFQSIKGSADQTGLSDQFADLIIVAQAFHWFEPKSTQREFRRIKKENGVVAILVNERKTSGSAFAEAYEALLSEFGTDYHVVKQRNQGEEQYRNFLGAFQEFHFQNFQDFDFEGLLGRLKSSSYAPKEDHPRYPEMKQQLRNIFSENEVQSVIRMEYDTKMYCSFFRS